MNPDREIRRDSYMRCEDTRTYLACTLSCRRVRRSRTRLAGRCRALFRAPTVCRYGFITRALDNGASLEEVQRAAGHADATTTKLYDRRGYNPEKSASFFASY
jgi:site-specific recombinase XerD